MLQYFIQTITFQIFFLLIFDIFLKKETFFNWNRMYLLVTFGLSLLLPFIKIERFKEAVPKDYIIQLPEVFIGQKPTLDPTVIDVANLPVNQPGWRIWEILFFSGICVAACLLIYKIVKLLVLIYRHPKQKSGGLYLVKLPQSSAAFSFFNVVFLGTQLNEEETKTILKHEMVHVDQKHSLDLLFFEVFRVLFWCNPLVYMYQNRMVTLHEFMADAQAVKHQGRSEYYQNLLQQVFDTKHLSFINPFFKQSLIKKRIIMLQKSRSKQIHVLKYALLIPVVFGMLAYTSSIQNVYFQEKTNQNNSQDLGQYSFSLNMDGEQSDGINEKYLAFESFLKNNNEDYVAWVSMDAKKKTSYYSVHKSSEKVPDGYFKTTYNLPDGSYTGYSRLVNSTDINVTKGQENVQKDSKWETDITYHQISLLERIQAVKEQIQSQGNVSDNEDYGLQLLYKIIQSDDLDQDLVAKVQAYTSKKNKTLLEQKISAVFHQIQAQGNISSEEEKALKQLLVFTSDGFDKPIFDDVMDDIEVPFAVIEHVPVYPGCENEEGNDAKKKCMAENVNKFVTLNFNTNIGKENGLTGRQRINVIFKINREGKVTGASARAGHPALEQEALRVINALPQMKPGVQKGKTVTVPYSLPIIFEVPAVKKTEQN